MFIFDLLIIKPLIMKKIVITIIAVIISASSFAQFHVGPQIGYTGSNLSIDKDSISNSLKSNFLVGAFFRFGKKIYVQPEINWLTQGSVFKYPSLGNLSPIEQNIKLNTIQVPVNIGWRIINLKVVNIRLFGGVVANFNTKTTIKTSGGDANYYDALPKEDDFAGIVWQWDAGVGVDVLMFAIDVKYMGGINNILKDFNYNGGTLSSKSNLFMVTLGWKIL
ncbi:MAG: hypothetical protein DRI88_01495 [Bacteroidetes bacterium]|nr:MAG: hypothetical protein DRI88_01495 [Bacteroidota bacterium]